MAGFREISLPRLSILLETFPAFSRLLRLHSLRILCYCWATGAVQSKVEIYFLPALHPIGPVLILPTGGLPIFRGVSHSPGRLPLPQKAAWLIPSQLSVTHWKALGKPCWELPSVEREVLSCVQSYQMRSSERNLCNKLLWPLAVEGII